MSDEITEAARAAMRQEHAADELLFEADACRSSVVALRGFLAGAAEHLSRGERAWLPFRRPETFALETPVGFREGQDLHRSLRQLTGLAARFGFRAGTPLRLPGGGHALMPLTWIGRAQVWPSAETPAARYAGSYRGFEKHEEPEIYDDLRAAVTRLRPPPGGVILSLGVHDASEWAPFVPLDGAATWQFWGLDTSPEGLAAARERYPEADRFHLVEGPIERASELGLPQADVLLCLNTLQSRSVDREAALAQIFRLLKPTCRVLFSQPQCHLTEADFVAAPLDRMHQREDRAPGLKAARHLIRSLYRQGFDEVVAFGRPYLYLLGKRRDKS